MPRMMALTIAQIAALTELADGKWRISSAIKHRSSLVSLRYHKLVDTRCNTCGEQWRITPEGRGVLCEWATLWMLP